MDKEFKYKSELTLPDDDRPIIFEHDFEPEPRQRCSESLELYGKIKLVWSWEDVVRIFLEEYSDECRMLNGDDVKVILKNVAEHYEGWQDVSEMIRTEIREYMENL